MVFDIYSKRKIRAEGLTPDVFSYDKIPTHVKTQIELLFSRTIDRDDIYAYVCNILKEEYGVHKLASVSVGYHRKPEAQLANELWAFYSRDIKIENVLDILDLLIRIIADEFEYSDPELAKTLTKTINQRFRESGVGFRYENGTFVRIDSEFLHSDVVVPALTILAQKRFSGVNDEFRDAHKHYREGQFDACLVECGRSFESIMKVICDEKGWDVEGDTAARLVDVILKNGLVPIYLQTQFTSLASLMKSGAAVLRNKEAAHGQGSKIREIPEHLASYALHLTATNLLFLASAAEL